jgi:hypothetical protein
MGIVSDIGETIVGLIVFGGFAALWLYLVLHSEDPR